MKNLTKMIAVAAAMGSMHFAKAESKEVTFVPTEKNGSIEQLAIVNGQLEVRASGAEIEGVKTPYMYVPTNTTDFASNAFGPGGLENVDKYVHVGNGLICIEAGNSDIYTMQIKQAPAALNGVTAVKKIGGETKSEAWASVATYNPELLDAFEESVASNYVTKVFNGKLYRAVNGDEQNSSKIAVYDPETGKWSAKNALATRQEIKDFYVVTRDETHVAAYALCVDDKVYSDRPSFTNGKEATALRLGDDKETIIIVNGGVTVYDGK
ncbi:MAG: hypothetical protein II830_02825, partial [Alphaproteobacteria bacterium]|nr:hypothetical protein [Alphaproteobacteria bacterium]